MEYNFSCHTERRANIYHWISLFVIALFLSINSGQYLSYGKAINSFKQDSSTAAEAQLAAHPEELIRFHVLANSDSDEDQALKRAVRDAILKEVSPRLAESHSLEESRKILTDLRPVMEEIGKSVVQAWGKDYEVKTDYGHFPFPTKSYGSLVLPAGDYEAVRVLIGKAEGSNWWCVLFPPLCFVDIEHSTAVPVDGKPGIPIQQGGKKSASKAVQGSSAKPEVKFWIWEKLKKFW
ncbi:stage II sporulation protein R [Desulfitobacterium sp. AusDCA]|uniref:stage II sporulation protein R n=1 Tax=Desulfitobacterium sp. AusDCA TaxID=3240383 RepID=UPI003DA714DE